MPTLGFEYKKKKSETPFETFLRYTNEKERSAHKLAVILRPLLKTDSHILDIGTGNGEYLSLALSNLDIPEGLRLTLVEPSEDLVMHIEKRFENYSFKDKLKVINTDLANFKSNEQYDVILMSHLFYHVPRPKWPEELTRALSLLKPGGALIVVLREKDDAYDFKMTFKPRLFDKSFKALTIDDVLAVLPGDTDLDIKKHKAASKLKIPFKDNEEDTISIIEFYLNKQWEETPEAIRDDALQFVRDRQGTFKQLDGIAVVKRV